MLPDLDLRTSSPIVDLAGKFPKPKGVQGIPGDATVSRNEKHWLYNCCLVASHVWHFGTPWTITLQDPVYGISQARILEWVTIPSLGDLPDLGIEPKLSYCCILKHWGLP